MKLSESSLAAWGKLNEAGTMMSGVWRSGKNIPGSDVDAILSPKLGLVFGPWAKTEFHLNAGTGFHSNDARGVVTTVDPVSGAPALPTPFLVRSQGAEAGLRTQVIKGLTSTLSVFVLDFDSEIVFVGDAGTTKASRPSRRIGAELATPLAVVPPGAPATVVGCPM